MRTTFVLKVLVGWLAVVAPLAGRADTALGDWGHFLSYHPRLHLHNPEGRAFAIRLQVMQWAVPAWNKPALPVRLTAPDGTVLHDGELALADGEAAIEVPAGAAGSYLLEPGGNVWVASTLERSVLWTGKTGGHMVEDRRACFQASVPRRWWFWVPAGTTSFVAKAQRADRYMSQREDWGFFVVSPRGQRLRALWGQPPHTPANDYRQEQVAEVEVEPGAAGRFWSVEVALGDSHQYSNINFCLAGVPPYLARSPEEWFDPEAGQPAVPPLYDDTPFIQSARLEPMMKERWPNLQHFSPCPSLGDPDGIEVLGAASFALSNPEGRELGLRIGTYLPRRDRKDPALAQVSVAGPTGEKLLAKALPLLHVHGNDGHPTDTVAGPAGVWTVAVGEAERWFAFTYPATPLVLLGQPVADGWQRFRFTACAPRNWYFQVPAGCRSFAVRFAVDLPTDVLHLEVNAPDRTLALLYDRQAEVVVEVPPGLDGRLWHLRPSVGSATRMITREAPPRYQDIPLTLELRGVPARLAPTWEQWFPAE